MNCSSNDCGCTTKTASATQAAAKTYAPAADFAVGEKEYVLGVDVPGTGPGDVSLTAKPGVLSLHVQIAPRDLAGGKRIRREYGVGDYRRDFKIAEDVDLEAVVAELKDGVLVVHLPKKPAAALRQVPIGA
jgi:HSP20 family protein